MAKKTAPKKKTAASKSKPVKPAKPAKAVKSVKAAKPAVKAKVKPAPAGKAAKPKKEEKAVSLKSPKPALMTKKGTVEEAPQAAPKKAGSIVSILEAEPVAEEVGKVEKVSKIKPVKVDRGNLNDEKAKWSELNKKYGREKAVTYKMTETYPSLIPLQHKVLGWGFILTNENDRLEVLFENGIRMLISNYKS